MTEKQSPKKGRPRISEEAMVQLCITVPPKDRELLRKIGNGNISRGVRSVLDVWKETVPIELPF